MTKQQTAASHRVVPEARGHCWVFQGTGGRADAEQGLELWSGSWEAWVQVLAGGL